MSSRPRSSRRTDDRGQILSSYAALAALAAIVAGLLVLLITRDNESAAGPQPPAQSTGQSTARASNTPTSSAPVITPPPSTPPPVTSTSTSAPPPTASPTDTATNRPTTTATRIPASDRPAVEVYNNTRRKGLADQVGDKARAVGWTVTGADNWRGKIVASTVYYPAGMQDAATELARVLGIGRTKDALANMKKDRLSVILTSDYAG